MISLFESIYHRPYVFIFLAAYLFLAWKRWGWPRTIIWLISGYFIAWLSEFSSIHNGFPYGEYHYIYENMSGELMIAGVPFFDSISYPFLIFAGFTTAEYILTGGGSKNESEFQHQTLHCLLLGSALTMALDVIIDPVAKLGKHWFLGEIYYYAHPGWYFDVPLSNFAGWFLVSLTVILFNMFVWYKYPNMLTKRSIRPIHILYPLFYISIALFNIAIALWIGASLLALVSFTILSIIAIATFSARFSD